MQQQSFSVYLLHFTSPLHIANLREDYGSSLQTFSSDAFYAALTATLASMGETLPSDGDLGCTISSLFPFYQAAADKKPVLFFPRALSSKLPPLREKDIKKSKSVKKVKYVDSEYFQRQLLGYTLFSDDEDLERIHGKFLSQQIEEEFIESQVVQRLSTHTDDDLPLPFYMDKVHFKDFSGLFFLCTGNTAMIDKAMPLLQTNGVGTDRSVGNGFFVYEKSTIEFKIDETSDTQLNLSTYIPSSQPELDKLMNHPALAYEMQRLGGWITDAAGSTLRKDAIYGLIAGSVFARSDTSLTRGKIVDLRPSIPMVTHPVWRCGRAIMVPIKL